MRKSVLTLLVAGLLTAAVIRPVQLRAAGPQSPKAPPALKVGDVAPDFTLNYFDGNDLKKVSLHDYHDKKNVLVGFYIFAFTGG